MAFNLHDRYPTETSLPSADYPYGKFRNRTAPTAKDGTKLEQDWSNDFFALHWSLIDAAGMTPNGQADKVGQSQYFDALLHVITQQKVQVSNALDGKRTDVAASEDALRRTYEVANAAVKRSGDVMTGSLQTRNTLSVRNAGVPDAQVGALITMANVAGQGTFRTERADGQPGGYVHTLPKASGELALGGVMSAGDIGQFRDPTSGFTMKWGSVYYGTYPGESVVTVTFNTPFDNDCYNVSLTRHIDGNNRDGDGGALLFSKNRHGFTMSCQAYYGSSWSSLRGFSWQAIGK